jgi:hypothetical protein
MPFGIATILVWSMALVSAATSEFKDSTTKLMWILIILFGSFLGALLYFAVGRTQAVHVRGVSAKSVVGVGIGLVAVALAIFGVGSIRSWSEHAEIDRRSKADIAASHAYFDSLRKAGNAGVSTSH